MRPFQPGQDFRHLLKTAIPEFVESEYPVFVEFLTAFVRFLEQERVISTETIHPQYGDDTITRTVTDTYGGPLYEARKLLEYRDTQTSLSDFQSQFMGMFAKNFPQYAYLSTDLLVQSLRAFYQNKGTADSYKWFFRAFFNEEASIHYPREDVFRASDAAWSGAQVIKVGIPLPEDNGGVVYTTEQVLQQYSGQRVSTLLGDGIAFVERVNAYNVSTDTGLLAVYELVLKFKSVQGGFEPPYETDGSPKRIVNIDSDIQIVTRLLPVITGVIIQNGGENYQVGDPITFIDGGGYGATGQVAATANAAIGGLEVVTPGDGFSVGEPVLFYSSSGTGADGIVASISNPRTLVYLDPIIDDIADVAIDAANYAPISANANIDTAISVLLEASTTYSYYTPWVWTDSSNTSANLANAALVITNISTRPFMNVETAVANGFTGSIYTLTDNTGASVPLNTTINAASSGVGTTLPQGYFPAGLAGNSTYGTGRTRLFLRQVNDLSKFNPSNAPIFIKQDYRHLLTGTVSVANNDTTVTGVNTVFTRDVSVNAHIRIGNTSVYQEAVVKSISNNTTLTLYAPATATASANTLSIYPLARIDVGGYTPRQVIAYGTVNAAALTSIGSGYFTTPTVSVTSVDARAQELFYYNANTDTISSTQNRQAPMYANASLRVTGGARQIAKVAITSSGVGYTNTAAVIVVAGRANSEITGTPAQLTPITGAVSNLTGRFLTTRSFASSNKYLQDGDLYNDYTYVVQTAESLDRYRDLVYQLIHPAGFGLRGQFVYTDAITTDLSAASTIEISITRQSQSVSPSDSPSISPSSSQSPSASVSPSASSSKSVSPSASVSPSSSISASVSPSSSYSASASISPSSSQSPSASVSPSASSSKSVSPSSSISSSASSSHSPSSSKSPSASVSPSSSASASGSPSPSVSPSSSDSPSASVSPSSSTSSSISPSLSPSASVSPSASISASISPSSSVSPSASVSASYSPSASKSPSASRSPSSSISPSLSPSASISPSSSVNQFAYPASDVTTGSWTPAVPSAALYTMINTPNVPNDTTYIESPLTQLQDLYVQLREGTGELINEWTIARTFGSPATTVLTLPAAIAATVTDWSTVQIWLQVNGDTDGNIAKFTLDAMDTPTSGDVYLYVRTNAVYP